MACIDSSGHISESAFLILSAIRKPAAAEEIAALTSLPLFRVRSGLREMVQAGLAEEQSGLFSPSESGKAALAHRK